MYLGVDISRECSLREDLFMGTKTFLTLWPSPWCLTLLKNFNLGYNFQMVYTWMLIFHMSVPWYKIYSWVSTFLILWPWCLNHVLKTLTLAITFNWYVLRCLYFTSVFLVTRSFNGYQHFDLVTLILMFDSFNKNFNLGYNLQMLCTTMLIFHMIVP
jgi:hypothetical protein